jgi:hypothetical protein
MQERRRRLTEAAEQYARTARLLGANVEDAQAEVRLALISNAGAPRDVI